MGTAGWPDATPEELEEAREFLKGRHPQSEWDAFFRYWEMTPRQRWWSRVFGTILQILCPWAD